MKKNLAALAIALGTLIAAVPTQAGVIDDLRDKFQGCEWNYRLCEMLRDLVQ